MIIETRNVSINNRQLDLVINRHERAKNFKIRFDSSGSKILLTIPKRGSVKTALDFYERSQEWISNHLPVIHEVTSFSHGSDLPFLDNIYKIQHSKLLTRFRLVDNILHITGAQERISSIVIEWLKIQAHQHLTMVSHKMAEQLGVTIKDVKIKELKTRWGSCSSRKTLNYSWRVIMAPAHVAEYLCAHEVSHLIEMNHSHRFWSLVRSICPHYKESRRWLRTEGKKLFAYEG